MPAAARAAEPASKNPLRVTLLFFALSYMATTFLNRNGFRLLPVNLGEIVLFCRLLLQHAGGGRGRQVHRMTCENSGAINCGECGKSGISHPSREEPQPGQREIG